MDEYKKSFEYPIDTVFYVYIEYTQVISSLIMELYMSDVLLSNVGSEDFKNFFGDEPSYYVDKTRFIH